ncbi:MAG: SDR family NAD(P)-dependent oxidoreductase, partial [Pseudomonadota bacterium]
MTGASSGLGFALAEKAVAAGHTVIGCVRKAEDQARIKALGANADSHLLDVSSSSAVFDVVDAAAREHGAPDIAVNNAGYGLIGPIEEASEA